RRPPRARGRRVARDRLVRQVAAARAAALGVALGGAIRAPAQAFRGVSLFRLPPAMTAARPRRRRRLLDAPEPDAHAVGIALAGADEDRAHEPLEPWRRRLEARHRPEVDERGIHGFSR